MQSPTSARLGTLEYAFFAVMLAVGCGIAAYVTRNPAINDAGIPPIVWPIGAAFAFDLVTVAIRGGGMPPLAMPLRAIGVIASMVLVAVLQGRI
jgi:hypothetical protein